MSESPFRESWRLEAQYQLQVVNTVGVGFRKNSKSNETRIHAQSYQDRLVLILDLELHQVLFYVYKLPS